VRTVRLSSVVAMLLATASLATATAPGAGAQRLDPRFDVGDVFPDLVLPSLDDGTPLRLSDFRGRKVMLHVFASW